MKPALVSVLEPVLAPAVERGAVVSAARAPYRGQRTVPAAPTIGVATGGDAQASVTFTASSSDGGYAISGYTVTSTPSGITASGSASPIVVTGLANDTAYTFTVHATNAMGDSAESAASNAVTPAGTDTSAWDPDNLAPGVIVSNANLTVTAPDDLHVYRARGLPAQSTGARALKFTSAFGSDASGFSVGLVPASWDATVDAGIENGGGFSIYASGFSAHDASSADLGLVIASGAALFVYVDFDAGKGWYDTASDVYATDRQAGTNPHFAFTANTPLNFAAALYGDGVTTTSATIVLNHSSGRFTTWS